MCNKDRGEETEKFVKEYLTRQNIKCLDTEHISDIYLPDFDLNLEVKSAELVIRNGKNNKRYGRFDFTDKKIRYNQRQVSNLLYVFVLRHKSQKTILGFIEPKLLLPIKRYYSLSDVANNNHLHEMFELKNYVEFRCVE